jgi:phosphohistidine phosphatase SixA
MRRISNDKTLNSLNASWVLTEKTSSMDISDSFSKSESNIGSFSHNPSFQELLVTLQTNSFCGNFQPSSLNILTKDDEWIRLPKRQKNKEMQINARLSRSNVSLDGSIESTIPC